MSSNHSERPAEVLVEAEDPVTLLKQVRSSLSRVYHDANNPLAIISGNAQYLLELARAMDLGEDLVQPIEDIEEASEQVSERLKELSRLKEQIRAYVAEEESA